MANEMQAAQDFRPKLNYKACIAFSESNLVALEDRNHFRKYPSTYLPTLCGFVSFSPMHRQAIQQCAKIFVQFDPTRVYKGNDFLIAIYVGSKQIRNLTLKFKDIKGFMNMLPPFGIVSKATPPVFLRCALGIYDDSFKFTAEVYTFLHRVQLGNLMSLRGEVEIPPFPEIFNQRTSVSPYFYYKVGEVLPADKVKFVFLPPLFLNTATTKCNNGSFRVSVMERNGFNSYEPRVLYEMKLDKEAPDSMAEIFGGKYFDRVSECEGLTFCARDQFIEPKSNRSRPYAFKLGEPFYARVLFEVSCTTGDINLINRCLQTARLYMSLLLELPEAYKIDVAVLLDVQQSRYDGDLFYFCKTIASKIFEKSNDVAKPVLELRQKCPQLKWFTERCDRLATYRAFEKDYHSPQKQRLWIVTRPHANFV